MIGRRRNPVEQGSSEPLPKRGWLLLMLGTWLVVSGLYALTSSGRLDTIDAQYKFAVTAAIVEDGEVRTKDAVLAREAPIALYPLGATLANLPLSLIGFEASPPSVERAQFLWMLSTAFIAALIPVTLLWAWRGQGVAPGSALRWAGVAAFATLIWPIATAAFDQAQHGWLLLVAVLMADRAAERRSVGLALAAGAVFSAVLHYQPTYVVLALPLAAGIFPWGANGSLGSRLTLVRAAAVGALPGLALLACFNFYRFDSPFILGAPSPVPVLGNPLVGLVVLLVSPGKGILFFTPVIVIAFLGFGEVWRRYCRLAVLIAGVSLTHLLLVSSLAFPGGDWCWGPRYLVVTLPLLCLLLPYGARRLSRKVCLVLVMVSVGVQLLGLSLDHHRFYFEHQLSKYFWASDSTFHLRHSQLFSRPGELFDAQAPSAFPHFNSSSTGLLTYAPSGPPFDQVHHPEAWLHQYAVFYWPLPWPLWMLRLEPAQWFVDVPRVIAFFLSMLVAGALVVWRGLRRSAQPTSDHAAES